MARIRTIKPEFFTSLTIASLALEARLTFIGLWTHCDDDGRCVDDTRLIRAALWPLDDRSFADVEKDLTALADASLIVRYTVSGRRYLAVTGWREHQKINRPSKSKLPAPPDRPEPAVSRENEESEPSEDASLNPHGDLTEDSLGERKGKERKGTGGTGPYSALGRNARDLEPPPSDETPTIVEQLITEYREESPHGISSKVATALAAEIHQLVRDGFNPDHIREGLWQLRPRKLGPGALASLVDEIANRPAAPTGNVVALRGTQPQPYIATSDRKIAQVDAAVAAVKAQIAQNGAAQ